MSRHSGRTARRRRSSCKRSTRRWGADRLLGGRRPMRCRRDHLPHRHHEVAVGPLGSSSPRWSPAASGATWGRERTSGRWRRRTGRQPPRQRESNPLGPCRHLPDSSRRPISRRPLPPLQPSLRHHLRPSRQRRGSRLQTSPPHTPCRSAPTVCGRMRRSSCSGCTKTGSRPRLFILQVCTWSNWDRSRRAETPASWSTISRRDSTSRLSSDPPRLETDTQFRASILRVIRASPRPEVPSRPWHWLTRSCRARYNDLRSVGDDRKQ